MKTKNNCPKCNLPNDDDWPLEINGEIREGGCQACWEKECDDKWWEAVATLPEEPLDKEPKIG